MTGWCAMVCPDVGSCLVVQGQVVLAVSMVLRIRIHGYCSMGEASRGDLLAVDAFEEMDSHHRPPFGCSMPMIISHSISAVVAAAPVYAASGMTCVQALS